MLLLLLGRIRLLLAAAVAEETISCVIIPIRVKHKNNLYEHSADFASRLGRIRTIRRKQEGSCNAKRDRVNCVGHQRGWRLPDRQVVLVESVGRQAAGFRNRAIDIAMHSGRVGVGCSECAERRVEACASGH
jgi:hypothetical protein